jgi:hypothetical protein
MDISTRVMETCLEKKKPAQGVMATVAAHPEDSNGVTWEKMIRATEG